MPQASIGDCGIGQYPNKAWITMELQLGICFIRHSCGVLPPGYELGILWHEHDSGEDATIGVSWDDDRDAPWDYISKAERALSRFDAAVTWSELYPDEEDDPDEDQEQDDDEEEPKAQERSSSSTSVAASARTV